MAWSGKSSGATPLFGTLIKTPPASCSWITWSLSSRQFWQAAVAMTAPTISA
ncbi:hypothetical protein [Sorangium sp. So ce1153]|uniref:hypothetical protein n=1 Tax=Sorangium sp. So ce1153 TaxID=3133333 RepID=UPI003F607D62